MKRTYVPYGAIFISLVTLAYSMYVAFDVTGGVLGDVRVIQLEPYGGVTLDHLAKLEFWRIFASQLIHAKQIHMLYNVLCLTLLGMVLERHIRAPGFVCVWFAAGAVGTLVSTLFSAPPWNLGTGASQAVIGIAAFGLVLHLKGAIASRWLVVVVCIALLPAFTLDFMHVGYPKPGHLAGALVGAIIAYVYAGSIRGKMLAGSRKAET